MPTYWLSDVQKFGIGFTAAGFAFLTLGIIFLLDRALLAMGNILLLLGLTLLLGPQRTLAFFSRRSKWRGTLAFWAGILLILMKWTLIGFLVEGYGMFILFGEFGNTLAGWAYSVPVVGPGLARVLRGVGESAGGGDRAHKDLPV